ncbi:alpha/beta family hydrolase [Frateuria aurantia]
MRGPILLSHGSDSGPDATKVSVLAAHAEQRGWSTRRLDYRAADRQGHAESVPLRLEALLQAIDACPQPPVLVGSSMGSFVSGLAAQRRPAAGLFLLATPLAIPGVAEAFACPAGVPACFVHGWRDDICPPDPVYAHAASQRAELLLLDGDHRLSDQLPAIVQAFDRFLTELEARA